MPLLSMTVSSLDASLGLSLAPPSNALWRTAPEICPLGATPIPAVLYLRPWTDEITSSTEEQSLHIDIDQKHRNIHILACYV
jgi:hypothetical protein